MLSYKRNMFINVILKNQSVLSYLGQACILMGTSLYPDGDKASRKFRISGTLYSPSTNTYSEQLGLY